MYSVQPINHLVSTVNIGIDILTHNKISNVYNDETPFFMVVTYEEEQRKIGFTKIVRYRVDPRIK